MTIILFLVDSSASMAQRNYMGCSAIDTAKAIVGDILKLRQRDINNRQSDRYMLLTTEEFPTCVKAGWKEGSQVFHEQLKALRPCGKFPLKQALMSALQFVNLNRAQTGVDYYGHGRFPHLQESVIIVTISDSSSVGDLPSDFELRVDSKHSLPGAEYTEEAFRWDQRLFSIVLRMGARAPAEPRIALAPPVSIEPGVIQRVCASTGGRSFTMTSHKQAGAVIEQLTQMIHVNGIVLRFEHPTPNPPPHNGTAENGEPSEERKAELASEKLRKALEEHPITFVLTRSRGPSHWPIPEAFWPDTVQASAKLPVRKAHPMLTIGLSPTEVQVNTDFPFDKYELDPVCALSDFVRERTAALGNVNVCWQVFVTNSYRVPGVGKPFGFLKTATNGSSVNLFLMPYNYPVLLKLLDDQKADARLRVHPDWRLKLDQYVISCPSYYKTQLKKGLLRLKLTGGLFDEQQQQVYAPQIVKMLNAMKTVGKEEMDKLQAEIAARIAKREAQRPISYMVDVEKRETIKPWRNFRIEWEALLTSLPGTTTQDSALQNMLIMQMLQQAHSAQEERAKKAKEVEGVLEFVSIGEEGSDEDSGDEDERPKRKKKEEEKAPVRAPKRPDKVKKADEVKKTADDSMKTLDSNPKKRVAISSSSSSSDEESEKEEARRVGGPPTLKRSKPSMATVPTASSSPAQVKKTDERASEPRRMTGAPPNLLRKKTELFRPWLSGLPPISSSLLKSAAEIPIETSIANRTAASALTLNPTTLTAQRTGEWKKETEKMIGMWTASQVQMLSVCKSEMPIGPPSGPGTSTSGGHRHNSFSSPSGCSHNLGSPQMMQQPQTFFPNQQVQSTTNGMHQQQQPVLPHAQPSMQRQNSQPSFSPLQQQPQHMGNMHQPVLQHGMQPQQMQQNMGNMQWQQPMMQQQQQQGHPPLPAPHPTLPHLQQPQHPMMPQQHQHGQMGMQQQQHLQPQSQMQQLQQQRIIQQRQQLLQQQPPQQAQADENERQRIFVERRIAEKRQTIAQMEQMRQQEQMMMMGGRGGGGMANQMGHSFPNQQQTFQPSRMQQQQPQPQPRQPITREAMQLYLIQQQNAQMEAQRAERQQAQQNHNMNRHM